MNKNQVFTQVASLVGAGHRESEALYHSALNLALAELSRVAPMEKSFTLRHFPPKALFQLTAPYGVTPTSPLTVSTLGVASFLVEGVGKGKLSILCDGAVHSSLSLAGDFSHLFSAEGLCGKERCELTLLFTAETPMTVTTLTVFDRDCEKDACGDRLRYFAPDYAADFYAFSGRVYYNRKELPAGEVAFLGDSLTLDREARGVYEIGYYASHKRAEALSGEEAFCVRREIEHLIPLLTAYYLLLEDGDASYEAYGTAYREGLDRYRRSRLVGEERVQDLYGW